MELKLQKTWQPPLAMSKMAQLSPRTLSMQHTLMLISMEQYMGLAVSRKVFLKPSPGSLKSVSSLPSGKA